MTQPQLPESNGRARLSVAERGARTKNSNCAASVNQFIVTDGEACAGLSVSHSHRDCGDLRQQFFCWPFIFD